MTEKEIVDTIRNASDDDILRILQHAMEQSKADAYLRALVAFVAWSAFLVYVAKIGA